MVDHEAEDGIRGLVSVRGVKLTTARAEAEKAVSLIFRRIGRAVPPCRTATTMLSAARPLEGGIADQVHRAAREEMAIHLADAVLRRTDLGTAGPAGKGELEAAAAAMASARSWDDSKTDAECEAVPSA